MILVNESGLQVQVDGDDAPALMERGLYRPVLKRYHPEGEPGTVLVARPYGGLGDVICLRPAVLQLHPEKTTLLLEKRYHCLFPEMPRCQEYPFHLAMTQHRYSHGSGRSFELCFDGLDERDWEWVFDCWCPCGEHEFDLFYRPTRGRVALFAEHLGVEVRQPDLRPVADMGLGIRWINRYIGPVHVRGKLIGIQVFTKQESKDWPMDRWQMLARELERMGHRVIALDGKQAVKLTPTTVPCVGLSLPEVFGVIAQLDLMIATDSGLLHSALALGVPTVGLFGPTSGELTLSGYPDTRSAWVQASGEGLSCRMPCYFSKAHNGYYCCLNKTTPLPSDCMKQIRGEVVLEAVERVL